MIMLALCTALAAAPNADTAFVDTSASEVRWKGTKFRGRGAHAGRIDVKQGWLTLDGMQLSAGRFELDMRSIRITDIPVEDSVPRRELRDHLLSEDFFAVSRYPTAIFVLDRARHQGAYRYQLDGRLTLRGVTRPFTFDATLWSFEPSRLHATATATLNRKDWGVAFRGSIIANNLVDDDIQLEFDIVARSQSTDRSRR